MKTFFAIKQAQTHAYTTEGKRLFVTKLATEALPVIFSKTQEKDGYNSVQIGIGKSAKINKPLAGHIKKEGLKPRTLKELPLDKGETVTADTIKVNDVFEVGDLVKIKAKSKGKGFQGGVKRWGFHGGPKTHGQSDRWRAPGSIGQGTTPGRINKGKHMAGHMGSDFLTLKGGQIVKIDEENNELWISGSIPGARGNLVEITKIKEGKFVGLLEKQESSSKNQVKASEEQVQPQEVKVEENQAEEVKTEINQTEETVKETKTEE